MTTPVDNDKPLVLYRLYGGSAQETGQYWTAEPRDGNLGYQLDYAMVPQWGCTLSRTTQLLVPQGIMLYEGYAAPQKVHVGSSDFGGGGWQVFIPNTVVEPLVNAMKAMMSPGEERAKVGDYLEKALREQRNILTKYEQEVKRRSEKALNDFCTMQNAQNLLKAGNALRNIPERTRAALQSESFSASQSTGGAPPEVPTENYLLHRQDIRLPNGKTVSVSLRVRLEFSHQTTRTTQSGRTIITTITKYYKRIFEWV